MTEQVTEEKRVGWRWTADRYPVLMLEVLTIDSGGYRLHSFPATQIPLHAAMLEQARRGFYG